MLLSSSTSLSKQFKDSSPTAQLLALFPYRHRLLSFQPFRKEGVQMKNAHLRFGWLTYFKSTEKTTTSIKLRLDRFIGEVLPDPSVPKSLRHFQ
jgi:hypothetical protein